MRKLLILTLAPAVLIAAGCGGSKKNPPATASGAQSQNPIQAAYKYSACMRQHGVSNFPDPHVVDHDGGKGIAIAVPAGVAASPAFNGAQKACKGIIPGPQDQSAAQQRARAQGLVSFARCMRAHHINSFPDPTTQGQINPQMLSAAGIDIHTPAVLQAAYACVSSSQGQLTRSDIAQVESGG
jgi:hypothetical protein